VACVALKISFAATRPRTRKLVPLLFRSCVAGQTFCIVGIARSETRVPRSASSAGFADEHIPCIAISIGAAGVQRACSRKMMAMSASGRCCRKRDFAMSGEQHRFKITCECAILIQKSARRDSIVSNSNSTVRLRRLFRQHRSKSEELKASITSPLLPSKAGVSADAPVGRLPACR
jgi:hypothetical protein